MNLVQVFITIFKNEGKVKRFWVNFFQSYRLSPRNCIRLAHLMLAIFSPVTYPFFEVLHLIKYTKKKLEMNKFLESERDLGTSLNEANIIWPIWIIPYTVWFIPFGFNGVILSAYEKTWNFRYRSNQRDFKQEWLIISTLLCRTKMNEPVLLAQKTQCNSCSNWVCHIMKCFLRILEIFDWQKLNLVVLRQYFGFSLWWSRWLESSAPVSDLEIVSFLAATKQSPFQFSLLNNHWSHDCIWHQRKTDSDSGFIKSIKPCSNFFYHTVKSILSKGLRPSIPKVFAFSCRIVFRLIFFTFGNLTILVFLLNDQRIEKWRGILLGDNVAILAGILLFSLNFIGLLLINGSGEYLSLLIKNWRSYRTKDKSWATIYNEFWKCMPFKLVMPFETEFLYVQSRQSKPSLTSPTYYLALLTEVLVPILLPFGSFTFAIFLTIGSYGCSG